VSGRRGFARGISRREFLGATAVLAGSVSPPRRAIAAPAPDIVVDVHCHTFNEKDLPVTGFVAHYVQGGALSDVSREVTPLPEAVVRRVLRWARGKVENNVPEAESEISTLLPALFGGDPVVGVNPLPAADLQKASDGILGKLTTSTFLKSMAGAVERLSYALYVVCHDHAKVAATISRTYPSVSLFVPLLVDFDAWSSDAPVTPLALQIQLHELVSKLAIRGKIGNGKALFHPFMAFDPLREVNVNLRQDPVVYKPYGDDRVFTPDAPYPCAAPLPADPTPWTQPRPVAAARGSMALVRHAVEQAGFIGVKLYPPVGFSALGNVNWNPSRDLGGRLDLALQALYAYCQAEDVPIAAHANASNSFALGYGELAGPEGWARALEQYPHLRLNLGHFGELHGVTRDRGIRGCEAWMRQAAVLMDTYPNVYADFSDSSAVHDDAFADRYFGHLSELFDKHPKAAGRVMYGSDWWLNTIDPSSEKAVDRLQGFLETRFGAKVRGDIMGRNALRFLGFSGPDDRPAASGNQRRLLAFYGQEKPPSWLKR